jgi:hypothetical protein
MKVILDAKALERLIGGDSEIEVELRNGVVQEFTRRHLKAVVNDQTFQKIVSDETSKLRLSCEAILEAEVYTTRTKPGPWGGKENVLKTELKKKLEEEASDMVRRVISKAIDAAVLRSTTEIDVKLAELDKRLDKIVNDRLHEIETKTVIAKCQQYLAKIAGEIKL